MGNTKIDEHSFWIDKGAKMISLEYSGLLLLSAYLLKASYILDIV